GNSTVTASDFTHATISPNTSPAVAVGNGPFVKLQLLVPGESAAPGTATGKTGAPTVENLDTAFPVTVNAVDSNWNLVSSATGLIGIASRDTVATLPRNGALVGGTQPSSVIFRTPGPQTVTATDLTDGTKPASTSPTISVGNAQYVAATGGSAISADT